MNKEEIKYQKELINKGNIKIELVSPCTVGNGVVKLSEEEKNYYASVFENQVNDIALTFFVPAAGSGSRMFGFLNEYKKDVNNIVAKAKTHRFIEALTVLPFYKFIDEKFGINELNLENRNDVIKIIDFILEDDGLGYSNFPKALIPFHIYDDDSIRTPIEEQILQSRAIVGGNIKLMLHFCVQEEHLDRIKKTVNSIIETNTINCEVKYSFQDKETDAFTFSNGNVFKVDDDFLKRPAGHGALLINVDNILSDYILIKNIDNVTHEYHSEKSRISRKFLTGFLLEKQKEIFSIINQIKSKEYSQFEISNWVRKNLDISEIDNLEGDFEHSVLHLLDRPVRVCGMVKNVGQPGGGPFWMKSKTGRYSKQIIEKAQIDVEDVKQLNIFEKSTHFNPVDIAAGIKRYDGTKFNLNDYIDDNQYFIVNKTHDGIPVQFVEKPGLWNGSMAKWVTFFVEVSNHSFSPVKTVLDLTNPQHLQ